MAYAVFKNNERISKWHKNKEQAVVELYELGAIYDAGTDFIGDEQYRGIHSSFSIKRSSDFFKIPGIKRIVK